MVQPQEQRSDTLFQYSNILQMFSVCGISKLFSSVTFKLELMTVSSGITAFSLNCFQEIFQNTSPEVTGSNQ